MYYRKAICPMSEEQQQSEVTERERNDNLSASDLTAKRAHELAQAGEGSMSYKEIATLYNTSKTTVKRRVDSYKEAHEDGINTVTNNPQEYDLEETIEDEETQSPYKETCPGCNKEIDVPEKTVAPCPDCGVTVDWSK